MERPLPPINVCGLRLPDGSLLIEFESRTRLDDSDEIYKVEILNSTGTEE